MSGLFRNIPGRQRQSEKVVNSLVVPHEQARENACKYGNGQGQDQEHTCIPYEHRHERKRIEQCDDKTVLAVIGMRSTNAGNSQSQKRNSLPVLASSITDAVEAIAVLYDRYHQMLYALAFRIVRDQQVAEDLLQEAFLGVWHSAHQYMPQQGSVRTWLFSIIHHRTIDYLRQAQRRATINKVPLEELEQEGAPQEADAWDEVWHNQQCLHVRQAVARLSHEQRSVIELAYFQGWTHRQIAEQTQLPLGTVKARLRLGLTRLRHILSEMEIYEI